MRVEVEDVWVRRNGAEVLKGVSLAADSGEAVAIVGPNGAGKTTLLLAVLGLLRPQRGRVRVGGEPVARLSRKEVARRVAYVPQFYEGYTGFRVIDVVVSGRYAWLDPVSPAGPDDRRAVAEALEACDLVGMEQRTVGSLSGGERQKVWLAAALAQGSPILLLDEPTNSLDPRHQAELVRLVRRQVADGKTVLVVCHDLNLPAMLGARVLALKAGSVVFSGSAEQFAEVSRLREIFETDFALAVEPTTGRRWIQVLA